MIRRTLFVLLIVATVLPLCSQEPNIPRNQSGRPGYFHFITMEQAEKETADIQRVNESLMRLGGQIAAVPDEKARQQMLSDLISVSTFVRNVEERRKPAGITAAEAERHLTSVKGEAHCGTCHGEATQKPQDLPKLP
jgi:mono/diheme cytochrome c family protein